MLERLIAGVSLVCVTSAVLLAQPASVQVDDFDGEFKVDKKKFADVRRVALVDVSGQAKKNKEKVAPWTEAATARVIERLRESGREVLAGRDVQAAFDEIAPMPTHEALKERLLKERASEQDAERTARSYMQFYAKHQPGDPIRWGYALHRPVGSVNLERPIFDEKDPRKTKTANEKEIRRRVAALRERLGVDSVMRLELGFGDIRWQEPEWQKQAKANGHVIGIVPLIGNIRGIFRGAQAQAFVGLAAFDADGRKMLVEVGGSCKSKQGAGLGGGSDDKIEAWMPGTVEGCIDQIFARLAKK
ncbi:MAG TPA: hypothetical protein VM364_15485 [Vicinamibacterales bacterium]|nr:hypothetical protein [Vicinamibacterales bacterium]